MCGIVGIKLFHEEPKKSDQNRVLDALSIQKHRGPDFTGCEIQGKAILGHNRLAIIDLNERANQPFKDVSGRYSLVFNGEIYNYPEIKNDLLKKGIVFHTSSDTEVLLYFLIERGEKGIKDLNGCFSFAFYDNKEDKLILARDHMGINPMLFAIREDAVLFASELSAFKHLLPDWSIDHNALNDYFKFTYIPAPKTILNEVQKLLPGHYLTVKGKDLDLVKYYSPVPSKIVEVSYEDAVTEVKSLVEQAVIKRLNADVPVGTFLSGGIDSSIVSAISANFKTDLHTFSIGFKGNNFFDESEYAKQVAEHIGSNHHAILLEEEGVLKDLPEVLNSFDEPFADSSAIAMYFLAKEAKQKLTVCLSGDGADEIFAGYNKHKAFLKSESPGFLLSTASQILGGVRGGSRNSRLANRLRQISKFSSLLKLNWPEKYWFLATFIPDNRRAELLIDFKDAEFSLNVGKSSLNSFLLADQQFILPGDMLKKVDLMSMKHSVEVRTPFLDTSIVDFVNSLPEDFKLFEGKTKRLLRDAFKDDLPEEIFNRSKKGFEVPLHDWMQKGWGGITDEKWFDSNYLRKQQIFNEKSVKSLKEVFFSKNAGESAVIIWAYIVFQNWYSRWTEK